MKIISTLLCLFLSVFISQSVLAADVEPTDVQLPGTQPAEIGNLESPDKCDNCHGGYNSAVEPAHNWRGSMMAHAGRDPIFWATMAIAEQDFDGVGDLCIRCHSTAGWLAGRSTPTDGSGLAAGDSDGVECDYCHKLANPDDSQHPGEMNGPFNANDEVEGYYGSGMSSMWGGNDKLGPYDDADARHQFMQSSFHRDVDFCGTCHDVSNPVTGDLAHNNGKMPGSPPVTASGIPGSPVEGKAAFNNPPYAYGITERTFSEYKSGLISQILVDDFDVEEDLPRGGVLEAIYLATTKNETQSANYQNPTADRYFSCQTCHMRAVTGTGANKRGVPVRTDLPLHDMTGGNYWMPSVIEYLDGKGQLRLGGGMSPDLITAMKDGALRAREQLELAATLEVEGNEVTVINHTGHKLITGYPEGRRMWLSIKWYDNNGLMVDEEEGEYGPLPGVFAYDGQATKFQVKSILDLENTHIWEAHMGMTKEWAEQLIGLDYPVDLPLAYDRESGEVSMTLEQLAGLASGASVETFHFALNNTVISDNRIPPYGMRYDEALKRNALPVPANQFEGGTPGSTYEHYDKIPLTPPAGATYAEINLMYQPTSWEYIQFLALANDGQNASLGQEGNFMLDAWLNTGMAEPLVMASTTWGSPTEEPSCVPDPPALTEALADDKKVTLGWSAINDENIISYGIYYDQSGKAQLVADSSCTSGQCSYTDLNLTNSQAYCYKLTTREDSCESGFSNIICATPEAPGQQQLAGVINLESGKWVREGKGKNATETFVLTTEFVQGDELVLRAQIVDETGSPVSGASFGLTISGPSSTVVTSSLSNGNGVAEASWSTEAPNKKGIGGTATGNYLATVSGMSSSGYNWDGSPIELSFNLGE